MGFCKESHPIDVGMEFQLVMVAFGRLLYSYIYVCQMEHIGDGICFVLHVSCVSIWGLNLFYVACILCVNIHSHKSGNHETAITSPIPF